jgi:hypothetical protein
MQWGAKAAHCEATAAAPRSEHRGQSSRSGDRGTMSPHRVPPAATLRTLQGTDAQKG